MTGIDFDAKVELTDSEWMSLIDGTRDDASLQKCCANISELRDQIITIARDGGCYHTWSTSFLRAYRAAADGHDLSGIPALMTLRDACLAHSGMTLDQLLETPHADPDYIEA